MKTTKLYFAPAAIFAVGLLMPISAGASPNKPVNAADPQSGEGCIVREADGAPFVIDPTCSYHWFYKFDRDGVLQSYRYQDKGELQPGQIAPQKAVRITSSTLVSIPDGDFICDVSEMITPSGQYSSNEKCKK